MVPTQDTNSKTSPKTRRKNVKTTTMNAEMNATAVVKNVEDAEKAVDGQSRLAHLVLPPLRLQTMTRSIANIAIVSMQPLVLGR